jgi:two-component system chemotaxis response regulator CheB
MTKESGMQTKDIIVIGASAGGVEALRRLCAALPADLPATVLVVQHLSPSARSALPQLLAKVGPLPAATPRDGEALATGRIYVAGPDHHLLLRPGHVLMRRGPFENRTRPAVNALFRSAAIAYGARVIGVVLTGLLDDGTDGLIAIKAVGGTSVVQDPADAEWPSMPRNALQRDHVDHAVKLDEMGALLSRLCREEAGLSIPPPEDYMVEDRIAAQDFASLDETLATPGRASKISCPDCGGVLNQIQTDKEIRFRCQVGHAFTPLGLAAMQSEELERALGVAVRTHRDRMRLFDQMKVNAADQGLLHAKARWETASAEAERFVAVLESAMTQLQKSPADGEG